jgi:hypothetical protein
MSKPTVSAAQRLRGGQAPIRPGRHADVQDRHVGRFVRQHRQQRPAVRRRTEHLVPGLGEQGGQGLAEQVLILRERYPHGDRGPAMVLYGAPDGAAHPRHLLPNALRLLALHTHQDDDQHRRILRGMVRARGVTDLDVDSGGPRQVIQTADDRVVRGPVDGHPKPVREALGTDLRCQPPNLDRPTGHGLLQRGDEPRLTQQRGIDLNLDFPQPRQHRPQLTLQRADQSEAITGLIAVAEQADVQHHRLQRLRDVVMQPLHKVTLAPPLGCLEPARAGR